jgi:ATP-dependent Zn protease
MSRTELLNRIATLLGGRAAEELRSMMFPSVLTTTFQELRILTAVW